MKGREGADIVIGESILEHIRRISGVEIDSECGGQGICGMDVVRIEEGAESLAEMTKAEKRFLEEGKLKPGQRLACQARIDKDWARADEIRQEINQLGWSVQDNSDGYSIIKED